MRAERRRVVVGRLRAAWIDAAASAVAAAIAWVLAQQVLGHSYPAFAAVAAIVCLAPGLPDHGRQAVALMLGVGTGIVVGEIVLQTVPGDLPPLRLVVATFAAVLAAAAFGQGPVVPIQAGVSAILILAIGPQSAGLVRMMDVTLGAVVGLVFSQVLLTPNPLRLLDRAADDLLARLRLSFAAEAEAAETGDPARAESGLQIVLAAHGAVVGLGAAIDTARSVARWSVRGLFSKRAVDATAARHERRAVRAYASALLFAETFAEAMRKHGTPPPPLAAAIRDTAKLCNPRHEPTTASRPDPDLPVAWRPSFERLRDAQAALRWFRRIEEAAKKARV
jgi:uncharacterized membrane protein YgaE (UPF0421/DUF939 family)